MALPTVGPLTSAMTGPNCSSCERSHSQALSRTGRPRLFKKPSVNCTATSGRAAARVPGHSGDCRYRSGHAVDCIVEHFGRQTPRGGMRIIESCRPRSTSWWQRTVDRFASYISVAGRAATSKSVRTNSSVKCSSNSGLVGGLPARISSSGSTKPEPVQSSPTVDSQNSWRSRDCSSR